MSTLLENEGAHWLAGARRCPSPNFNERPAGTSISLVVIHGISLPPGQFGGPWIDQLFTNCLQVAAHPYFAEIASLKVSAHLLLHRDGQLTQYVPFDKRAWHAGQSQWRDRSNCNDFSIGIELEGTDDIPYTDDQYHALKNLLQCLKRTYPSIIDVAGHSDIAPGRKIDPGPAFDWSRLEGVGGLHMPGGFVA